MASEWLPRMEPTPCGVCGSVIGEGLMLTHMQACPGRQRRTGLYGAKCTRCSCIVHDRDITAVAVWPLAPLECADCDDCQARAFTRFVQEHGGLDLFSPEVREAVTAMRSGKAHPLVDQLRAEIQAEGT